MTAPLNKATDCCGSEIDEEIAGLAFSYEDWNDEFADVFV